MEDEIKDFNSLVNKKIIAVEYDPGDGWGTFSLIFDDGTRADFSHIGDDASWTTFKLS